MEIEKNFHSCRLFGFIYQTIDAYDDFSSIHNFSPPPFPPFSHLLVSLNIEFVHEMLNAVPKLDLSTFLI